MLIHPIDISHLIIIRDKKIRNHLMDQIDFDVNKLKFYAFKEIGGLMYEAEDDLDKKEEKSKKRKINSELCHDSELNDEKKMIIEIIGTKVTNIKLKLYNFWSHHDIFNLHGVKDVDIIVPMDNQEYYSSLFYHDKFIRVNTKNDKIDVLIWDLKNCEKLCNHYYITRKYLPGDNGSVMMHYDNSEIIQ